MNQTEIAHAEGPDALDVRLTRAVIRERRAELRADPRIRLRPSSSADWLEVAVHTAEDEGFALALVEQAAQAHRA